MIRKSARSVKKPEFFNFKEQLSSSKSVRFSNVELSDTEDDDEEGDNDDKEDEITTNNKVIIKTSVSNVKRKSTQFIPAAGSFMDQFLRNDTYGGLIKSWLDKYKKDKVSAVVTLVNFLLMSAGSQREWVAEDVDLEALEPEELDVLLQDMMQMMSAAESSANYPCPLNDKSKSKSSKLSFRDKFVSFWDEWTNEMLSLAAGGAKKSLGLEVLRSALDQLISLSSMAVTSIRLSITEASLSISRSILRQCQVLKDQLETVRRQISSEESHKDKQQQSSSSSSSKQNPKHQAYLKQQEAVTRELEALCEFASTLFNSIAVHRLKDFKHEVRACAVLYLNDFILFDTKKPVRSEHLKYLGWACYDHDSPVRLNAIKAIKDLLTTDVVAHLQGFVEHFIDRFIVIAAVDIDFNLSVAMIEVLRLMQSHGLLDSVTEDKLDLVDRVVFDSGANPKLRQHALAFLMDHTEGFEETDGRDDTSAAVLEKKGRGKKTKGGDKTLHLTPMIKRKVSLQLETLTEFAEHHLEDHLSNSYMLAEACIALKKYDIVYNWTVFVSLLLKENEEWLSTALRPSQITVLVHMFVYSALDLNAKRRDDTQCSAHVIESWEALNECLIQHLPSLLTHYRNDNDETNLLDLVSLLEVCEYHANSDRQLKALLKVVLDIFEISRDGEVLSMVVGAFRRWMDLKGTTAGTVEIALKKLFNDCWDVTSSSIPQLQRLVESISNAKPSSSGTKRRKSKSSPSQHDKEELILTLHVSLLKLKLFCEQIDCRSYVDGVSIEQVVDELIEVTELVPVLCEVEPLDKRLADLCVDTARNTIAVIYSNTFWHFHDVQELRDQIQEKHDKKKNEKKKKQKQQQQKVRSPSQSTVTTVEDDEAEEQPRAADPKMDKLVAAAVERVLYLRDKLVDVLHTWLQLGCDAVSPAEEDDGSSSSSSSNAVVLRFDDVSRALRLLAFNFIQDLRDCFFVKIKQHQYLDGLVFAPSQELLTALRKEFETEGDRLKMQLSKLDPDDPKQKQLHNELSLQLIESLLRPLANHLIDDVENLNRRQAAAVLYYLLDCNPLVEDAVRQLMRQLKEADTVKFLEIHIVALKGLFSDCVMKALQARNTADEEDDLGFDFQSSEKVEEDGYDRVELLARKLSQSLGIAKLKDTHLLGLVNLFKASIDYAFSDGDLCLGYVCCLGYYVRFLPPHSVRDVAQHFNHCLESHPSIEASLDEHRAHSTAARYLKVIDFADQINGRGRPKMTTSSSRRKSITFEDGFDAEHEVDHDGGGRADMNAVTAVAANQAKVTARNPTVKKMKPSTKSAPVLEIKSQVLLEEDVTLVTAKGALLPSSGRSNTATTTTTVVARKTREKAVEMSKWRQPSAHAAAVRSRAVHSEDGQSDYEDNQSSSQQQQESEKSMSQKASTPHIVFGLDIEDDDENDDNDEQEEDLEQEGSSAEDEHSSPSISASHSRKRPSDVSVLDSIPSRRRFR